MQNINCYIKKWVEDMNNISLNTKLEIAVEVMAAQIATFSKKGFAVQDKEMQDLLKERNQMYQGEERVIEAIIQRYGMKTKNKSKRGE